MSLTVLQTEGIRHKEKKGVLCRCECGTEFITAAYYVQEKRVVSCGCLKTIRGHKLGKANTTHGVTQHYLYRTWSNMMHRCYCDYAEHFSDYGGRGIQVYDKWHDAPIFIHDIVLLLGDRPHGYELERMNNNGDYHPENVRWATRTEQNRNRRNNKFLTINGVTQCLGAWSKETGIPLVTLCARYAKGKTGTDVIAPTRKRQ